MATEALRRAIILSGEHEVAWLAGNAAQAVEQCKKNTPDLMLMDLIMREMGGVEATKRIMEECPCPILIVTASVEENAEMVFRAMGAGAVDAVSTPFICGEYGATGTHNLLKKINVIGRLAKHAKAIAEMDRRGRTPIGVGRDTLVVMGASSGGPQALSEILGALPNDFPAPVVVIQHVDEQFAPEFASWLSGQTDLRVRVARSGENLHKACVYVAGKNEHLVITRTGVLGYSAEPRTLSYRPSVDVFIQSALRYWHGQLMGVLLTGMGRDGAQGLLQLRQHGGRTIVQNERTSAVYGMPKAAIELGAALEVLPLKQIAPALLRTLTQKPIKTAQ